MDKYGEIKAAQAAGKATPEMASAAWAIGETHLAWDIFTSGKLPLGDEETMTMTVIDNTGWSFPMTIKARPVIGTDLAITTEGKPLVGEGMLFLKSAKAFNGVWY